MAALGKRGRAHANTAIATSKDLICQNILSKRQLPAGRALSLSMCLIRVNRAVLKSADVLLYSQCQSVSACGLQLGAAGMTLSAAHGVTVMHAAGKEDNTGPMRHHLFHDETKALFFRRLAWSPDGDCPLYLLLSLRSTTWQQAGLIAEAVTVQ